MILSLGNLWAYLKYYLTKLYIAVVIATKPSHIDLRNAMEPTSFDLISVSLIS